MVLFKPIKLPIAMIPIFLVVDQLYGLVLSPLLNETMSCEAEAGSVTMKFAGQTKAYHQLR